MSSCPRCVARVCWVAGLVPWLAWWLAGRAAAAGHPARHSACVAARQTSSLPPTGVSRAGSGAEYSAAVMAAPPAPQ